MEGSLFLNRPQKPIHVLAWNINAAKTKLEKDNIINILCKYDIVSLSEIKTSLRVSLPGYIAFTSRNRDAPSRGGVCVLVKEYLRDTIMEVDTSTPDQVWLSLSCAVGVLFGFVYIPPIDSPYFTEASLSSLQERVKTNPDKNMIIIGDMNARFGRAIKNLPNYLITDYDIDYPTIPDPIPAPNHHAQILFGLCCEENIVPVNNLKFDDNHFRGALTYRQGRVWKSEVDVCLISLDLAKHIHNFEVLQQDNLPSDHAPIGLSVRLPNTDWRDTLERSRQLGDHAALHSHLRTKMLCKKPIKFTRIDAGRFTHQVMRAPLPELTGVVEEDVSTLSSSIYRMVEDSLTEPTRPTHHALPAQLAAPVQPAQPAQLAHLQPAPSLPLFKDCPAVSLDVAVAKASDDIGEAYRSVMI